MKNGHFNNCTTPDDCWCEVKRYWFLFVLALIIFAGEVVGGIISGSLALLADAGHVLTDTIAMLVSIITAYYVKRKRWSEKSIRAIGGVINALLLLAIAIWISVEGMERINHPRDIISKTMMAFAIFGALGNWLQYKVLGTLKEEHVTHKAMRLHILSDLFQSATVVLGGVAIYFTQKNIIDPVLSVGIALWMAWRAWNLIIQIKEGHSHHHAHHRH